MAFLALFFACGALLVTAIGLYGTLAYATARRTSEIGIRMALGARRADVAIMVLRENLLVASVGTGAGLIAAVLVSRALASFLYETSPRDPSVLVCSVAALTLISDSEMALVNETSFPKTRRQTAGCKSPVAQWRGAVQPSRNTHF